MRYYYWSEICLIKRIKFGLISNIFIVELQRTSGCLTVFIPLWIKEQGIGENETHIPLGIFQSFGSQDGFGSGMNLKGFRRSERSSCSLRECVIWDFHLPVESSYLQSLFLESTTFHTCKGFFMLWSNTWSNLITQNWTTLPSAVNAQNNSWLSGPDPDPDYTIMMLFPYKGDTNIVQIGLLYYVLVFLSYFLPFPMKGQFLLCSTCIKNSNILVYSFKEIV